MTDKFSEYLQAYFSKPSSKSQAEVADMAGISSGYISHLVSGAKRGSEDARRAVAAAIGVPYEEAMGISSSSPDMPEGISRPLPLCAAALDRIAEARPEAAERLFLVPVIRMDAALAGAWTDGDVTGWVMVRRRREADSLIAVALDGLPSRCYPATAGVAVVDLEDREPVDGRCYITRPPSKFPVAQVMRREGLYIIAFCGADGPGVQTFSAAQFPDLIIGRVVRIAYELKGGGY